jgi:hypothetical protein
LFRSLKFMLPLLRGEGCCWKCRGVADADGCCFRRGGRKEESPLMLPLACIFSWLRKLLMMLLLILTVTNAGDGAHRWRSACWMTHNIA